MKKCSKCKIEKDLSCFNKDKRRKDGLTYHCKECVSYYGKTRKGLVDREHINALQKTWKRNNPEKVRKQWIKQVYKLDWEDYTKMFGNQNGCCKLCNKPLKLHKGIDSLFDVAVVDHCHSTGKVRGLLCDMCNKGLGHFEDNIQTLLNAVEYLRQGIMSKEEYLAEIKKMRG